jgi:5'-nucleotidase / UDP-sugar diphosphatase
VARRATKIEQEHKSGKPVLVVDAGNSLSGDREPAQNSKGASSIDAMNLLGYDAIGLGPRDLELGPEVLRSRIAEAQFAVLSANAMVRNTQTLIAEPYLVRDISGHRVAIVALSGGTDVGEIVVRDPLAAAKDVVMRAKDEADEIVILSTASSAVNREIADAVPGVTAIVEGGDGASARPWVSSVSGVPIFHADQATSGHAGRLLGVARLNLDADGRLAHYEWIRFSLGPEVPDDPTVTKWVETKTREEEQ